MPSVALGVELLRPVGEAVDISPAEISHWGPGFLCVVLWDGGSLTRSGSPASSRTGGTLSLNLLKRGGGWWGDKWRVTEVNGR